VQNSGWGSIKRRPVTFAMPAEVKPERRHVALRKPSCEPLVEAILVTVNAPSVHEDDNSLR
jgi:hypothetical protein